MPKFTFAKEKKHHHGLDKKIKKILIVDDEPSIHEVTQMAITSMDFSDYELKILTAYSSDEAKKTLEDESDIALALIDVVMETPDSGLQLVNYIRHELQNSLIRLIIRTGQANEFPQMHVIQHYDINDFKEKTELTMERLYTTIRTSINQYDQLIELQNKYEDTYRQMTTNPLTRLPNRTKLIEDFANESHQTLILIDIIGFSIINETNGYEIGDYVLKELGGFLSTMYGESFRVYHLNNDLFALVSSAETIDDLVGTVEAIKEDISHLNIVTDNFNKTIETTIGVAYQSDHDVLRKAELALKEARNTGKNQIKFYSSDLKVIQQIHHTNQWAPIIKQAINENKLLAYAQPIFDTQEDKIQKYELLVRLEHEGKVIPPGEFLDAANYSGQLFNIFKFMFEQGCQQAKKTGNKYTINISDSELHQEGLIEFMKQTVGKYELNTALIALEILEYNAVTHSEEMRQTVLEIDSMGIEFIVDDFGVQCSNFAQTEFLPIKTLKIDGSFIKNLHESKDSQIIVKTIKTFAKEKEFKLIAEFVCNKEVYDAVKAMGIRYMQGYYLGKPEPLH